MPYYSYKCHSCETIFERVLKIAEMKQPEVDPCTTCGQTTVLRHIDKAPIWADAARIGDTAKLPGGFKDVLRKITDAVPGSNLKLKYN